MEKRNRRIMVVEKDDAERNMLLRILQMHNFETESFGSPSAALERIKHNSTNRSHYALVIADNSMQTVNDGLELTREIYRVNPVIPVVMVAVTTYYLNDQVRPLNLKEIVRKPWGMHQMLGLVDRYRLQGNE
jgi:CheY-like chemotaxis protein